ncbi:hypothetical protein DN545_39440, partial [Burkholderia multivorans]
LVNRVVTSRGHCQVERPKIRCKRIAPVNDDGTWYFRFGLSYRRYQYNWRQIPNRLSKAVDDHSYDGFTVHLRTAHLHQNIVAVRVKAKATLCFVGTENLELICLRNRTDILGIWLIGNVLTRHFSGNYDEVSHFKRAVILHPRDLFLPHATAKPDKRYLKPTTDLSDSAVHSCTIENDDVRPIELEPLLKETRERAVPNGKTPR